VIYNLWATETILTYVVEERILILHRHWFSIEYQSLPNSYMALQLIFWTNSTMTELTNNKEQKIYGIKQVWRAVEKYRKFKIKNKLIRLVFGLYLSIFSHLKCL
jgi:hypothetical protein